MLQLFLVVGLTLGYPLTEKITNRKVVYWGLAGAVFALGLVCMFFIHSRRLNKILVDSSMKISMATVLLRKVWRS